MKKVAGWKGNLVIKGRKVSVTISANIFVLRMIVARRIFVVPKEGNQRKGANKAKHNNNENGKEATANKL